MCVCFNAHGAEGEYNDCVRLSDHFNLTAPQFMKHRFLHPYRVIVVVCIGVVLLLPAILDRPKYEKYATQWETDGAFVANGRPNPRDFPSRVLRSPDARFWRNYPPAKDKMPAHLRSAPFVLSSNRIIIPVVGFPNSEEAGIYLESETDHQRFWIRDGVLHRTIFSAVGKASTKWTTSPATDQPNCSTTARSRSNSPITTATKPFSKPSWILLQQPARTV